MLSLRKSVASLPSILLQGGTQDCALVADGENWLDNTLLRYPLDEPARHKVGQCSRLMGKQREGLAGGVSVRKETKREAEDCRMVYPLG
jgi:hypothetical protein